MGFPVVTGSQLLESQPLVIGEEENSRRLHATNVNIDSSLMVSLTILYPPEGSSELGRNNDSSSSLWGHEAQSLEDKKEVVLYVNIYLQIISTVEGASSSLNSDQVSFRIPMFAGDYSTNSPVDPTAIFSSDGHYLTCLIPTMRKNVAPQLVIFNLRTLDDSQKKKQHNNNSNKYYQNLPTPSFIPKQQISEKKHRQRGPIRYTSSPIEVTNKYGYSDGRKKTPTPVDPCIVDLSLLQSSSIISCICDAVVPYMNKNTQDTSSTTTASILLMGTTDGTILSVNYKTKVLHELFSSTTDDDSIRSMCHYSYLPPAFRTSMSLPKQYQDSDCLQINNGKLAVLCEDGKVYVHQTKFVRPETKENKQNQMMNGHTQKNNKEKSEYYVLKVNLLNQFTPPQRFCDILWINSNLISLANGSRGKNLVAQVWFVNSDRNNKLVSELEMTPDRLSHNMHSVFNPNSNNTNNPFPEDKDEDGDDKEEENGDNSGPKTEQQSVSGIHLDAFSGCLAITGQMTCSKYNSYSKTRSVQFACIWDWNTNTLGLALAAKNTIHSKMFFCGYSLFHMHFSGDKQHKSIYPLGYLSPSITSNLSGNGRGSWVDSVSPLFLTKNSVAFPFLSKSNSSFDKILEWKEFSIPKEYLTDYGSPTIASIGVRGGRSVAIASSRGLCVLDLSLMKKQSDENNKSFLESPNLPCMSVSSRDNNNTSWSSASVLKNTLPKWRTIMNQTDEESFCVHAMVWWERGEDDTKKSTTEEDFLFAVIESSTFNNNSFQRKFYLVCWSRRRLGLGDDQILKNHTELHWSEMSSKFLKSSQNNESELPGILLPSNVSPDSLSILPQPNSGDRALLLISSSTSDYVAVQVQTVGDTNNIVYAKMASQGSLLQEKTEGKVFLAGGSFGFDLSSPNKSEEDFMATLGVIKIDSMEAYLISSSSSSSRDDPILSSGSVFHSKDSVLRSVAKYWLSDIVTGEYFIWTIALNDGTIFTWSVPFFTSSSSSCKQTHTVSGNNATGSNNLEEEAKELDSILKWPLRGPHTVDTSSEILGICSCIFGDSTLWMNGVNTTNKNEICIGSVPSCTFGNVLYSGQDCRKMNQNIVGTRRIVIDLFGLSNCTIAAPTYSVSLLSLLLQCNNSFAQHTIEGEEELQDIEKKREQKKVKQIRCHILQSLSTFHDDSMATALKVLVLRSIEYLSEIMSFASNEYSDIITSEKVEFARSLLEEIISLAKLSLNELHFAALFLGIGRQIEPHHFNLLFPLRLSPVYMDTELTQHLSSLEDITVEDLFDISLQEGSVCIAASALPMFSCKYDSHLKCIELLKTCLEDISSSSLSSSNNFEEKYVLQQLFQFGIKLEEAGRPYSTANSVASTPVGEDDDNLSSDNTNIRSDMNYDSDVDDEEENNSSEEKKQDGLLSKIPSIRNILTTPSKVWKSRAEEKKKEETEIQNAAADFIMAGFDDDHPPNKKNNTQGGGGGGTPGTNGNQLLHGIDDSYLSDNETSQLTITDYVPYECFIAVNGSISGVVCKYILKTIFANPTRSRQRYHQRHNSKWNQIASIAELLVGDLYEQYFYSSYDDKKSDLTRILNEALNGVLSPTLLSNLLNTNVYENSVDILIKNCFMKLISECEEQIGSLKAGIVFELIIVLLLQYDHCEYIRSSRAELATVGIVAGHVSGKLIGVLEGNSTWTYTPLGSSYLSAAEIYEA